MPDKSPGREGRKLTLCVALKALASKTSVYSSRREGRNTRSNKTRLGGSGGRLVGRVVGVLGDRREGGGQHRKGASGTAVTIKGGGSSVRGKIVIHTACGRGRSTQYYVPIQARNEEHGGVHPQDGTNRLKNPPTHPTKVFFRVRVSRQCYTAY